MTHEAIGSAQVNYTYVILISVLITTNNAINSTSLKVSKLHNAKNRQTTKLSWLGGVSEESMLFGWFYG